MYLSWVGAPCRTAQTRSTNTGFSRASRAECEWHHSPGERRRGSGRSDSVAISPRVASTAMRALGLQMRRAATVLLVVLSLGHAQFTLACAPAITGMPCCPASGPQSLGVQSDCTGAATCLLHCAASLHCACDRSVQTATVSAREIPSSQGVPLLAPVWPEPPVLAHQKPPPQGPPSTMLAVPTGRHTYLATLRLRI